MQDTGADAAAPTHEPRSRRRLLGAGLVGLAGSLLPQLSGQVSATTPPTDGTGDTEPAATTTTAPPTRPTVDDLALLRFAEQLELGAVLMYDSAITSGAVSDQATVFATLRESHQAYAQVLSGFLGTSASREASPEVVTQFGERFAGSLDDILAAAYDFEATALASHAELVGQLAGTEGSALIASILIAEARHATVLADVAGADLDAQLLSDADALEPTKG